MNKINYFGYDVDNLSMTETVDKIDRIIKKEQSIQHVVINVAKLVNSQKDELLRDSITSADIINIDGAGIIYGMKMLGLKPKERVAGIDLMQNLLELAGEKGYSVYFLGAKQDVLDKMVQKVKNKYPNIIFSGSRNGYWKTDDEEKYIVDEISSLNPNLLFVGISSPKKELFIAKNKEKLNCNIIMGVGGSFDVIAGITKRAPEFMQKYGLEWLYRIYQEPRRMWKRYLVTNTKYILLIVKELFAGNRKKTNKNI